MIVKRAIFQTLGSRQISLAVMAVSTVVLARLLTPVDFGVFATAIAITTVAATIIDFGLPEFLIQKSRIDRETLASAAGLTLVLAVAIVAVLCIALLFLPIGILPPAMRPVLALLLVALLVKPLTMPIETTLRREVKFGLVSILSVVKVATQATVAIALAVSGFGALSLAGGVLAETVLATTILIFAGGHGRLARPSLKKWPLLSAFGLRYTAIALLSKIGDLLIALSITRLLGLSSLGQLDRARTVVQLVDRSLLDGIEPVVLPALSHLLRDGSDPAALYMAKTRYLAALCWPAFAVIALLAEPLVAVFLGPQWDTTVPAVQILALIGLFLPFTKMSRKLFIAFGMTKKYLYLQIIHQSLRVALTAGGALISFHAACLGIAAAYGVKAFLVMPPIKAVTGYSVTELLSVCLRCMGMTVCAVVGPASLLVLAPGLSNIMMLTSGISLAGLGWLLGAAMMRDPLLAEIATMVGFRLPAFLTAGGRKHDSG
ncbi:MAG: oligosaccharide flippase family protein [Gammaproteobacteria bacterium]|nr:oligosaccharide flippase family protein [Gammaproteobacteria bacterium]